jgi:uncharacterized protein (TIGR01244 family)
MNINRQELSMFKTVMTTSVVSFFLLLSSTFSIADGYLPNDKTASFEAAPLIEIKNAKRPFPGILTGGQPTQAQLEMAKEKGFKTIVNLRMVGENKDWDEAKLVESLGMKYVSIPVAGATGLTRQNSEAVIAALEDAGEYPVMVHCASGNRVGALFALDANIRAKLPKEDALAIGRKAGMTRLEADVIKKLK